MKKIIYFLLLILLIGCTNTKVQSKTMNEPEIEQKTVKEKNKTELKKPIDDRGWIQKNELNNMYLPKPASLKEISDQLTDEERNRITFIRIDNGEKINTLDGINLFPALEILYIYNSQIKNLNDIHRKYLNIKRLLIESNEMEDVSNIVLFENLENLDLWGLEKIKSFPDISSLKKLWALSLNNLKGIKLNNLAEKLPLGIQMIELRNCNINSLDEISNFFKRKIGLFDLSDNPIKEIDFNKDYGTAEYIYMPGCPISERYFKWDKVGSEEYPEKVRNAKGVTFAFGYYEEFMWVKEK
jgi:Leucine-rich repeat (LRR) protein